VQLLRRVIGDALRARRQGQHRTLREVSTAANVSLGYLSEIERGQKEASSELLASICDALGSQLSEVLREASDSLARAERTDAALTDAALTDAALTGALLTDSIRPDAPASDRAIQPAPEVPYAHAGDRTVTDGKVSVSVRRNGPLRTTLHAVRTRRPDPSRTRSS
jgi:transcriptional regulator with XRE-family HTH domain